MAFGGWNECASSAFDEHLGEHLCEDQKMVHHLFTVMSLSKHQETSVYIDVSVYLDRSDYQLS